jgi:predicted CopG family antitoxin
MERKHTGFTTIYISQELVDKLDALKTHHKDSRQDVIKKLIKTRSFEVVNNEVITQEKL